MKANSLKIIIASIIFTSFGQVQAGFVNSNSITQDGIEYYFQTDKAVYDLGKNVLMLYRVTNLGVEDVTFGFTAGPVDDRGDFVVEKDVDRIWDNLGRPRARVITSFTLSPLEFKDFTRSWDMTNLNDNQVIPGKYDVTSALGDLNLAYTERYVPVSVQIEVVPEPASLLLFGTGLIVILTRNKKMTKK